MKRTKSVARKQELSFFKVISDDKRMGLPRGNIRRVQGLLGRKVTLRDVDRNLWTVEVSRDGDGFYFDKGWPQFHQENHVEPGDYVSFDYKHSGLFDFILLGGDGCVKKGAGCPRSSVKVEVEEVYELTDDEDDDDDDEDEDDDVDDDDDEDEDDDDDEDEDYVLEQWKKLKEEEIEDESDEDDEIEVLMKGSKSRSSPSSSSLRQKKHDKEDYYGRHIFRSGLAVQPQNPYFVSTSRKLRRNVLHIPNEVRERWKLKFKSKMLVVDASGRKWGSKIKKWSDGRVWCTGGWKRMCAANNISTHDTCICEFVQRGSDGMYMLVHAVGAPK
ncbi:B3 domain-containing protein REM20-like [Salvia hispanica]|uniref:B3 domain-containing protein REM20-like n=1 Tax=Salvia hispanica TaxID=49212 RepID=UPI0020092004|nr:B3 domain-containing protein REM20-like [Salvia hispanica]